MERPFHSVRPAAVAGQFYPADPTQLRQMVNAFLESGKRFPGPSPKAVIAPHAGFVYSGPIAGSAFAHWQAEANAIKQIILLGPSHRVPFLGLAASSASAFTTPLGRVALDRTAIAKALEFPQVQEFDEAHAEEHSLEVELPFLQVVLKDFTLVPLAVGDADDAEVADVLEALWNGKETRIVVSSDLTHYLDYDSARTQDEITAKYIESMKPEKLEADCACGCIPIRRLLRAAKRRHLTVHTVDLRNSGDTAGSRRQVVGYGAFVLQEPLSPVA
jgi:MEMO1 family protein